MKKHLLLFIAITLFSCESEKKSSEKQFISYKIEAEKNGLPKDIIGLIDHTDYTIRLDDVSEGKELIATFEAIGEVYIGSILQISGTTSNVYDSQLSYTVIAEDGSQIVYTVIITNTTPILPAQFYSYQIIFEQNGEEVVENGIFSPDSSIITITPKSQNWINNMDAATAIFETDGSVWIEETEQTSGETKNDYRNELVYLVKNNVETKSYTVQVVSPQTTGLPNIKIDTEGKAGINDKENYIPSMIKVIDKEQPEHALEASAGVRGRGNSTWGYIKKPYRIKFGEKTSMFGLGAAKNWVLLANYLDPTFIMNTIAFELGHWLGFDFVNHSNHVELFLNDEYLGNYVLTEQVEVNKHRVNIDEETDFLVEFDRYYDEDFKFKSPFTNLPVNIKSPELKDESGMYFIRQAIEKLDEALYGETTRFPENNYADLIDIPTLIDYILVNEIVRNRELLIPGSVYLHRKGNDKMKMGPLWDFDWGFGYMEIDHHYFENAQTRLYKEYGQHSYGPGGSFFFRFFDDPAFRIAYKNRWNEIKKNLLDLEKLIDEKRDYLLKSSIENNKRWNKNIDFSGEIDKMKAWLNIRIEFLDEDINKY
ncbi:MAG: CotH kinase family protein [Tannerellaceae bacterium]|jgi:hypothetical protein|nr:CotH kinase family protein [Tannerellaceae bacterium]